MLFFLEYSEGVFVINRYWPMLALTSSRGTLMTSCWGSEASGGCMLVTSKLRHWYALAMLSSTSLMSMKEKSELATTAPCPNFSYPK